MNPEKDDSVTANISNADSGRLRSMIRWVSVLNALGLGAAGVFGMISISPSQIITAFYVAVFGLVLLAFEMHLRRFEIWVVHNFGFMASFRGRAMYFMFTGSLCFGLGIIGIIVGAFGVCNGLFNLYIYYRREDVRKQLEQQTNEILEEVRKADNAEGGISLDMNRIAGDIAMQQVKASVAESVGAMPKLMPAPGAAK